MSRWERLATALLLLAAAAAALSKAGTSPLTIDEAWNWSDWIRKGPAHIFGDYRFANNHILQTAASWLSREAFGEAEWALRLPSVLGFLLFLLGTALLLPLFLPSPAGRLVTLALVAAHPYLLDFGALARGYSLMLGLTTLAAALLWRSLPESPAVSPPLKEKLALTGASLACGLAVGCLPLAVEPAGAVGAAYLLLFLLRGRSLAALRHRLGWLLFPGGLVVFLVYFPVRDQLRPDRFFYGARTWEESLRSLHWTLAYVPQARVDRDAYPILAPPVVSWAEEALPAWLHGLGTAPAFWTGWLLSAVLGAAEAFGSLRRHPPPKSAALGLWLCFLTGGLVLRALLGVPLPRTRTWLPFFPPLWLNAARGARLLGRLRPLRPVLGALVLLLLFHQLDRIHLRGSYWEWPTNAVFPRALADAASVAPPGKPVTLGHVWYAHGILAYYVQRWGLRTVRLAPYGRAMEPVWDLILWAAPVLPRDRFPGYRPLRTYPPFAVALLTRP